MQPDQARRVGAAIRPIDGWFSAVGLFAFLDEVQKSAGVSGDLFEIGAHHGKSAVVLANLARPPETIGICDLFGSQSLNASASGAGDRAIVEHNMATLAPGANVRIFECPSGELTLDQIGRTRFFHIDGGHLAPEAMNDLLLGSAATIAAGLIVVDDPYRPEWPGVTEAILGFLAKSPEWVTVAVGFNKQVLARRDHAHHYSSALNGDRVWNFLDHRVYERKSLPISGADAVIFHVPSYRQIKGLEHLAARGRWALDAVKRRLPAPRA